jgi:hypothetical protein
MQQMKENANVLSKWFYHSARARLVRGSTFVRCGLACGLVVFLAACQTPPVHVAPCGVIRDSLKDVRGASPADTKRIDIHFERGRAAGCWR